MAGPPGASTQDGPELNPAPDHTERLGHNFQPRSENSSSNNRARTGYGINPAKDSNIYRVPAGCTALVSTLNTSPRFSLTTTMGRFYYWSYFLEGN